MDSRRIDAMFQEVGENPIDLFTSNEIIDTIQLYDSTIEIVGYIDGIDSTRYVGNKLQYKFFKFYLNNGNGRRIQIVAWNDQIERIEHHIMSNYVSTKHYQDDMATYTNEEYYDMLMVLGECHGQYHVAARRYADLYPNRARHPSASVVLQAAQRLFETGSVLPKKKDTGRHRN
ncbi:PREDICTED: uncharacterized protein LOC105461713, partial [Wasmannia auropunctata]|uniref:uncharacterized protein LOC105461713 n=1 Tax=Wasmannia auropunctata TaxID=64793 RepID=UPI0005EE16CE